MVQVPAVVPLAWNDPANGLREHPSPPATVSLNVACAMTHGAPTISEGATTMRSGVAETMVGRER
jgi:hypothetical protein